MNDTCYQVVYYVNGVEFIFTNQLFVTTKQAHKYINARQLAHFSLTVVPFDENRSNYAL
jgi:hypothetical protein